MLIEFHVLQNHVPSNVNRDDLGAPKTAYFGQTLRARISSQCQKRVIRRSEAFTKGVAEAVKGQKIENGGLGIRTKYFPELIREVLEQRKKSLHIPAADFHQVVCGCCNIAKAEKSGAQNEKKKKVDDRPQTPQLIFISPMEATQIVARLDMIYQDKSLGEEYKAFLNPLAMYQEIVAGLLEDTSFKDAEKKKIVKAAWHWGQKRPWAEETDTENGENASRVLTETDAEEYLEWINNLPADELKEKLTPPKGNSDEKWEDYKPARTLKMPRFWDALRGNVTTTVPDIALFGRMTTSDAFQNVEACMEVAHAISTHKVDPEVDYFTAMDDRPTPGQTGSAHIGENQFNSATYYKYFSLDWDAFVQALGGPEPDEESKKLAGDTVAAFIRALAQETPSGKRKGHAHNNLPDAILVEVKKRKIPTNYANAFLKPAVPGRDGDLMLSSIRMLNDYAARIVKGFEIDSERKWFSATYPRPDMDDGAPPIFRCDENTSITDSLGDLISWTLERLKKGGAR
ncbi:MAG TPA: type I-E CRISPR-associated protein Cas7/Cse4/CasC [Planctomycetota bacterium]|jgi:CRISPR system Cascade subunit CasC